MITEELARGPITPCTQGDKRSNKLKPGMDRVKKLDDVAKLFAGDNGLTATSQSRNAGLITIMANMINGCRGRDVIQNVDRANDQKSLPHGGSVIGTISDHPRSFFQEDHPTDNPAILMYTCEGRDFSDLELDDGEDEDAVMARLARIKNIEQAIRSMFYEYGCDVRWCSAINDPLTCSTRTARQNLCVPFCVQKGHIVRSRSLSTAIEG